MFSRAYISRGGIAVPEAPVSGVRIIDADLPLCRKLRLLLDRRWTDAGEAPPRLSLPETERLASMLWEASGLPHTIDPRCLAHEMGLQCRAAPVTGCYGEQTDGRFILYRSTGGPREWGLRVLHGVAHWALLRRRHSEADAWRLTLALAVDFDRLRSDGAEVYLEAHGYLPAWLVGLYQ